jgi:hypothetical protein
MVWAVGAALAIAVAATMAAILARTCTNADVPAWVWYVIAALWAVIAALIALWYVLCETTSCPCPTKCDWLQIATMGALATFAFASWLTPCCPEVMVPISIGFGLTFFGALGFWYGECGPSLCTVLLAFSVALVSAAGEAIGIASLSPTLLACSSSVVNAAIGSISAVIVLLTAANCSET